MSTSIITKRSCRSAMPWVVAFWAIGSVAPATRAEDIEQSSNIVSDEEFRLPIDDKTAQEVDELMEQLGSPVYEEREAASTRLAEIGAPAFAKLQQVYPQTDDIEVRLRIESIVYEGYLNFRVYDRNGFLGIQQQLIALTHTDDPRIGEGQLGIRITRIIPETGAAKANIKKDDIIVRLNDEPLRVQSEQATLAFGERLREMGPASRIKLRVLRGSETMEIEATLGRRPMQYYRGRSTAEDMLRKASGGFDAWWVHHFRQQGTPGDGD